MANNNKNTLWKVKIIVEYYFSIKIYVKLLNKGKCVYIIICVILRKNTLSENIAPRAIRSAHLRALRDIVSWEMCIRIEFLELPFPKDAINH